MRGQIFVPPRIRHWMQILADRYNHPRGLGFVAMSQSQDAKNYACMLALQHVEGALPLERKLPDPYREAWLSLKSAAPTVTMRNRFACRKDQERHEEEKRLASLVKEKEKESKYSKVRMSDSQRQMVQEIIRSVQSEDAQGVPGAAATSSPASALADFDDADADDASSPMGSAAMVSERAVDPTTPLLLAELARLGFHALDARQAAAYTATQDWARVEAEREAAEAATAAAAAAAKSSAQGKKGGLICTYFLLACVKWSVYAHRV
jgi:hypothetical protein